VATKTVRHDEHDDHKGEPARSSGLRSRLLFGLAFVTFVRFVADCLYSCASWLTLSIFVARCLRDRPGPRRTHS